MQQTLWHKSFRPCTELGTVEKKKGDRPFSENLERI